MRTEVARDVPVALERIRGRLERWRRTRRGRARIPEELWGRAVQAVGTYGLNKTARALGLDYYSLKQRVAAAGGQTQRAAPRGWPDGSAGAGGAGMAPPGAGVR